MNEVKMDLKNKLRELKALGVDQPGKRQVVSDRSRIY